MIDRQIWRGLFSATLVALALMLAPANGFAFPQSTETSGEIVPNLSGAWLVMNRLEFPKPTPAASPSPGAAAASPGPAAVRNLSVAYVFTIDHLATAEALKIREADKALKQTAVDKANKILAEELKKGGEPKLAADGTPVEPKVLTYGVARPAESVADEQDEIAVHLLDVELPKSIQDAIDKANKEEKVWEPTENDLTLLKSSWKTLKSRGAKSEFSRIQWKVLQDKYLDGGMLQDEKTKNAKFVISGDASLIAGPGQANRTIIVYGAEKVSDRVIEGGHVRAIMTAAPFPIPIDMKGTFKMIRLTDPKPEPKKKDK